MSKWIRVSDSSVPAVGKLVIVYDGCCVMFGHYAGRDTSFNHIFCMGSNQGWSTAITHWQELPAPPENYTTDGKRVYYKGMSMSPEYITQLLNMVGSEIENKAKA
jgi:hypothetical protein